MYDLHQRVRVETETGDDFIGTIIGHAFLNRPSVARRPVSEVVQTMYLVQLPGTGAWVAKYHTHLTVLVVHPDSLHPVDEDGNRL